MASLYTLPNELIDIIIANVNDVASLSSLCLCSRFLNSLATPYLYHRVGLMTMRQLHHFLGAMIEKPMLGSLVRSFAMHYDYDRLDDYFDYDDKTNWSFDSRLLEAVKSQGYAEELEKRCIEESYGGKDIDILMALLLPTLTNLNLLDAIPLQESSRMAGWLPLQWMGVEKCGVRSRALFENLTHIGGLVQRSKACPCDCVLTLEEAEMLLRVPSLRSFSASIHVQDDVSYTEAHSSWLLPAGSSNVTHLELWTIDIPYAAVTRIVKSCGCLRTFILEWWEDDQGFEFIPFSRTEFCNTFVSTTKHLENLSLERGSLPWYPRHADFFLEPIGSLTSFEKLKHLRLDMLDLFYDSTEYHCGKLPPNIERLSIVCAERAGTYNHLLKNLRDLFTISRERYPQLRTIDVEIPLKHTFQPGPAIYWLPEVQAEAAEVDISLASKMRYWEKQYWGMDKLEQPEPKIRGPRRSAYDYDSCHPR